MNYWLTGWRLFWQERKAHQFTREAYDNLVVEHRRQVVALREEEERSSRAFFAATEPCPRCEEFERERNNAILDLDSARADLDDLHAALAWLERDFKVQ